MLRSLQHFFTFTLINTAILSFYISYYYYRDVQIQASEPRTETY